MNHEWHRTWWRYIVNWLWGLIDIVRGLVMLATLGLLSEWWAGQELELMRVLDGIEIKQYGCPTCMCDRIVVIEEHETDILP